MQLKRNNAKTGAKRTTRITNPLGGNCIRVTSPAQGVLREAGRRQGHNNTAEVVDVTSHRHSWVQAPTVLVSFAREGSTRRDRKALGAEKKEQLKSSTVSNRQSSQFQASTAVMDFAGA